MSTPSFNPFDFDDYNDSDPYDYDEAEETADILADPDTMTAIAEGESEDAYEGKEYPVGNDDGEWY